MTIKVLLVDDHPVVREGLGLILSTQDDIEVIGEASDGGEAVKKVKQLTPDITIMDLDMPVLDGAEAIRQIRADNPEARIIVLTAYDTDERILDAVEAGAQGYLLKGAPRDEVFRAVRVVHQGGSLLQPAVASKLLHRMGQILHRDTEDRLTDRELEVLQLMATGARNKEIAEKLFITERTVKFHISIIFQKLGVSSRTEAIAKAVQQRLVKL